MEKYISIINSPTSATDCVVSGNTVSITGLKPFLKSNVKSCKIKKSLWLTPLQVQSQQITPTAGGTYSFSITQTVNGILQTFYFSYVVDTLANLDAAIDAWSLSSNADVTVAGVPAGSAISLNVASASPDVTFEVGGQFVSSTGVSTVMNFSRVVTTVRNCTTSRKDSAYLQIDSTAAHGLKTGTIVSCSDFTGNGTVLNGNFYRVGYVDANTLLLYNMDGSLVFSSNATASGTDGELTVIPSSKYGTYEQVNAEAAANGSTETATSTTYSYSCVEITGTYENSAMGNLSQPQLFTANVWYADAAADGVVSVADAGAAYNFDVALFNAGIIG